MPDDITETTRDETTGFSEREIAISWRRKLEETIDELFARHDVTHDKFIDILWQEGIMNRLSPDDETVREARRNTSRALWEGSREDPEFYTRIVYSALASQYAQEHGWTFTSSNDGYMHGVMWGIMHVLKSAEYRAILEGNKRNLVHEVEHNVIERAKDELRKRHVEPSIIPIGTHVRWRNYGMIVDRYTFDGLLAMQADDPDGHTEIFREGGFKRTCLSPTAQFDLEDSR